jgi:hypothetical protein
MDRYGDGKGSTWIRREIYDYRPTWQELYDLGMECYRWLLSDPYAKRYCVTEATTSCLVAVGCYESRKNGRSTWFIFCGTILRGPLRVHMEVNGRHAARHWYEAATTDRYGKDVSPWFQGRWRCPVPAPLVSPTYMPSS